jgi:hypothetical protein
MLKTKDSPSPSKMLTRKGARNNTGLSINYLPSKIDKRIIINVSGIKYETYYNTLKLLKHGRLADLNETNSDYDPIKNEYFFDRHPSAFLSILTFYRTGKLHLPADLCANAFRDELDFWGIDVKYFTPCCWARYSTQNDADSTLYKILKKDNLEKGLNLIIFILIIFYEKFYLIYTEKNETEEKSDFEDSSSIEASPYKLRKKSSLLRRPNASRYTVCSLFLRKLKNRIWRFLNDRKSSLAAQVINLI